MKHILLLVALVTMLAGCDLAKAYPQREFFAFEPGAAPAATGQPMDIIVRVNAVHIAAPYDTRKFTYRTSADAFDTDYYNGFVDVPDRLLAGGMVEWLSASKVFRVTVGPESNVQSDLQVETNVVEMYGDYRDKKAPKAVISARVFLLNQEGVATQVLFERKYDAVVPVKGPKAADLAAGFGQAWREILLHASADLAKVKLPATVTTQP